MKIFTNTIVKAETLFDGYYYFSFLINPCIVTTQKSINNIIANKIQKYT